MMAYDFGSEASLRKGDEDEVRYDFSGGGSLRADENMPSLAPDVATISKQNKSLWAEIERPSFAETGKIAKVVVDIGKAKPEVLQSPEMITYAEAFEGANKNTLNPYRLEDATEILKRRGSVYSQPNEDDSAFKKFYKRMANVGSEVRFLDESPFDPVTTGNTVADIIADFAGFGLGLIGPSGPGGAITSGGGAALKGADYALIPVAKQLSALGEKGFAGRRAKQAIHGAVAGTGYGAAEGVVKGEDLPGIGKTAGIEAATFAVAEPLFGTLGEGLIGGARMINKNISRRLTPVEEIPAGLGGDIGANKELLALPVHKDPLALMEGINWEFHPGADFTVDIAGKAMQKGEAYPPAKVPGVEYGGAFADAGRVTPFADGYIPRSDIVPTDFTVTPYGNIYRGEPRTEQWPEPEMLMLPSGPDWFADPYGIIRGEPGITLALPEGKGTKGSKFIRQDEAAIPRSDIGDPAYLSEMGKQYNSLIEAEVSRMKSDLGGVVKYRPGEDAPVLRASQNPAWYREFWQKHLRAPREGEWRDLAIRNLIEGDPETGMPADNDFLAILSELSRGQKLPEEWHGLQESIRDMSAFEGPELTGLIGEMRTAQAKVEPYGLTRNINRLSELEGDYRGRMKDEADFGQYEGVKFKRDGALSGQEFAPIEERMFKKEAPPEIQRQLDNATEILGWRKIWSPNALKSERFKVANELNKLLTGKDVITYTSNEGELGFAIGRQVFLNSRSRQPTLYVTAHEIAHTIEVSHPEYHDKFKGIIFEHIADEEGIQKQYVKRFGYKPEEVPNELTADVLAECMMEKSFWMRVRENAPELLKPILDTIERIIKIAEKQAGVPGKYEVTTKYMRDVELMRDRLAEVYRDYLKSAKEEQAFVEQYGHLWREPAAKEAKKRKGEVDFAEGAKVQGKPEFAPMFYSQLQRVIEQKMPNRATPEQIKGVVSKGGVRKDELKWADLDGFLEGKQRVTKQEMMDYLKQNDVQVQEVSGGNTYERYVLPGGENYRELLLTLPGEPVYWSSHWDDAPNVLAHIRFNDRTGANGEKILHVEEIQSDWHQEGRKEGYGEKVPSRDDLESQGWKIQKVVIDGDKPSDDPNNHAYAAQRYLTNQWGPKAKTKDDAWRLLIKQQTKPGIPDAPFKNTWHELAMKRMIRYAAENGYDRLTWTTGAQQAERYDLSKYVSEMAYWKEDGDTWGVSILDKDGRALDSWNPKEGLTESELESQLGKEIATKIIRDEGDANPEVSEYIDGSTGKLDPDVSVIQEDGLKVGGSGMSGFYDKMIPAWINKYAKKWGARVEPTEKSIQDAGSGYDKPFYAEVHSIPITNAMKESVLYEGQPKFKRELTPEQELDMEVLKVVAQQRKFGPFTINKVTMAPEALERPDFKAAGEIAEKLGLRLVPFKSKGGNRGAYYEGTLYINEGITDPLEYVFFHEVTHSMQEFQPAHYAKLLDLSFEHLADAEGVNKHYMEQGYARADRPDEFAADVFAEAMSTPGFFARIAERAPELIKPLLEAIDLLIANAKSIIGRDDTIIPYMRDWETLRLRIRDEVATPYFKDAMGEAQAGEFLNKGLKNPAAKSKAAEVATLQREIPLNERLKGDSLLDAQDTIAEIRNVGANVSENGYVVLYHRTSKQAADNILKTGKMKGKENGLFFSTLKEGQAEGYGDTVLEFKFPIEKIQLDDIFAGEAHFRLPLKNLKETLDISQYIATRHQTNTPEFRKWFGDSKVVDDAGNPLVVYHGTWQPDFTTFDTSKSGKSNYYYGDAIYFTSDPSIASGYTVDPKNDVVGKRLTDKAIAASNKYMEHKSKMFRLKDESEVKAWQDEYEKLKDLSTSASERRMVRKGELFDDPMKGEYDTPSRIYPVYLSIRNPYLVDAGGAWHTDIGLRDIISDAKASGHDGVIIKNVIDSKNPKNLKPADDYIAFYPEQIKSVYNQGTFDPANPDIRYKRSSEQDILSTLEQQARERLRSRLEAPKGFKSNHSPTDNVADITLIGAAKMRENPDYNQWVGEMIADLGQGVEVYLPYAWRAGKNLIDKGRVIITDGNKEIPLNLKEMAKVVREEQVVGDMGEVDTRKHIVSKTERDPFIAKESAKLAYIRAVDDLYRLDELDKFVAKTTGKHLPTGDKAYLLAINSREATGAARAILEENLVDAQGNIIGQSFKDVLSGIPKGKEQDFRDYLVLRNSISWMEQGKTVYPEKWEMTPEKAAQRLAAYDQQIPELKQVADEYVNWHRAMTEAWLVDTGVITPEAWEAFLNAHPHYTPFQRQMKPVEIAQGQGKARRGFANQTNPTKKAEGSERPIIDPIESTIEQVDRYIKTAKRNEVMQAVIRNLEKAPEELEGFAEIIPEKGGDILSDINAILEKEGIDGVIDYLEEPFEQMIARKNKAEQPLGKPNIVRALVDGKRVHVKVNDPVLLDALTALSGTGTNTLVEAFRTATRMMKILTTGGNPIFAARNIARDVPMAYVASDTLSNLPIVREAQFAWGMIDALARVVTNERWHPDKFYREYKAMGGGSHTASVATDRNLLAESKSNVMPGYWRMENNNPLTYARKGAKAGFHGIERFTSTVEALPRLPEYIRTVKKGGNDYASRLEGLHASQDVTVNFSRRGDISRDADAFIPYFNAAVQGIEKIARMWGKNPLGATYRSLVAVTIPTVFLYCMNTDNPEYHKLSSITRDNYYCIPIQDGEKFIKIAKPREIGVVFSNLPERALRQWEDDDPEGFYQFSEAWINNFLPPIRPIVMPFADVMRNKDFAERPIVPGYMEGLSPELQYDEKTSEAAKAIGSALGISPKQVDYLFRSYTGFIGELGIPAMAEGRGQNIGQRVGEVLKRSFVADPLYSTDIMNKFYEEKEMYDTAAKDYKSTGNKGENLNPQKQKYFTQQASKISDIRKEMRRINASTALSFEEKERRTRILQDRMMRIAQQSVRDRLPQKAAR